MLLAGAAIVAVLVAFDVGGHTTIVRVEQPSTTVNDAPTATSSPRTEVPPGDPIGKIDIPPLDIHWVFVQGSRPEDEASGPIHDPDSPMPGEDGNVVIAGHRSTHGAPFYRLDELRPGDVIQITTLNGGFAYIVDGSFVVTPHGDPLFPENILERTQGVATAPVRSRSSPTSPGTPPRSDWSSPRGWNGAGRHCARP